MLILPPVGLIMYVFAKPLTAFFVPGEDYGIHHGAMFIKIMAPNFGLLGVQQVMIGVFNGAGFTTASMLISILALWVIRFPLAYVLSHNTGLSFDRIWLAFPASNLIAASVAFFWFRTGQWKDRLTSTDSLE